MRQPALHTTRVLPIVGLDVGAIGSSSLVSFSSGLTFAIWLFVVIFDFSFSIELRLSGGGFSIPPPSAILVRCLQCLKNGLIQVFLSMGHVKLFILLFLALTKALTLFSQTKADSISLTFPKIVIINNKKEVLLAFDQNRKAYEIPSIGTIDGPISLKSYIDETAKTIGITYKSFRLGGIFTYIFPDRYRTLIRPYYVVQFRNYSNGSNFTDTSYKWFSFNNAVKEIPYPASSKIVERILTQFKSVWGATFEEYGYTNPVDKTKIKFKVLENFYKLNQ